MALEAIQVFDFCLQVMLNDRTLNELWTSVSSRSMTMHFFPTSSARISGSSCFVDLLWLFCLESRHKSPDPDAPEPPIPLPTKDDSRPFFPFPFLFLPRQQIMEQSKLDLFFVSEIRLTWWNYKIQEPPIIYCISTCGYLYVQFYLFVEHRFPFGQWKGVKRHCCLELLELLRKTGPLNGVH